MDVYCSILRNAKGDNIAVLYTPKTTNIEEVIKQAIAEYQKIPSSVNDFKVENMWVDSLNRAHYLIIYNGAGDVYYLQSVRIYQSQS